MVTFEFYQNSYLGSAIPESAFSGVAARAEAALAKIKRIYLVREAGKISESLAICAMAEELYRNSQRDRDVLQNTVGAVSVRYKENKESVSKALLRMASVYLDIYRGVEQ